MKMPVFDAVQIRRDTIALLGFLIVAVFAAHFLLINEFGLYEDDYAGIPYINGDAGIGAALKAGYHDRARPVGRALRYSLNYVGAEAGGLVGMYLFGYVFIALNTILSFLIIRRIAPDYIAAIGALVFCLYPADTTKVLLTHSLQIQPGLTFCLLGILFYQTGRRVSPYILAFLSLLTYETTMLPFLAAPFLVREPGGGMLKRWIVHAAVLAGFVLVALLYRQLAGEARVAGLEGVGVLDLVARIGAAVVMGPLTSVSMFLYRPVTAIQEGGIWAYAVMAVFAVALYMVLRYAAPAAGGDAQAPRGASRQWDRLGVAVDISYTPEAGRALRLLFVGAALWCASYVFAFSDDHWPPIATGGRMTSVHIAATFAAAVTLSGLAWLAYLVLRNRGKAGRFLTAFLSLWLATLAGFSYVVQEDYARSWAAQKAFWSRVIELAPDLDGEKVVWLGGRLDKLARDTEYIAAHSWADRLVLSGLYEYQKQGAPRLRWPRFDLVTRQLVESIEVRDGRVHFKSPKIGPAREEVVIKPRDIIYLKLTESGELRRYLGFLRHRSFVLNITKPTERASLPETNIHRFITSPG